MILTLPLYTLESQIEFIAALRKNNIIDEINFGYDQIINSLQMFKNYIGNTKSENVLVSMSITDYKEWEEFKKFKEFKKQYEREQINFQNTKL